VQVFTDQVLWKNPAFVYQAVTLGSVRMTCMHKIFVLGDRVLMDGQLAGLSLETGEIRCRLL
jgi:hypothetical protein